VLTVLGIASIAAAVPVMLRGLAVAPMWAAAGTATLTIGARRKRTAIVACGVLMLVLSGWDLLARRLPVHPEAYTPFLNGRFLAFAAPCVALAVCAWILRRAGRQRLGAGVLLTLGVWTFTPLLAHELWARYVLLPVGERGGAAREAAEVLRSVGLALWVALLARAARGRGTAGFVLLLVPLAGALLAGGALYARRRRVRSECARCRAVRQCLRSGSCSLATKPSLAQPPARRCARARSRADRPCRSRNAW
jgi:hypothetical protein